MTDPNLALWSAFFGWCLVLNFGLLLLFSLFSVVAGDFAYRLHSRWFPMSRETFAVVFYCFIGFYKLLVFFFNLVPWLALQMMVGG